MDNEKTQTGGPLNKETDDNVQDLTLQGQHRHSVYQEKMKRTFQRLNAKKKK